MAGTNHGSRTGSPVARALAAARAELDQVDADRPDEALPHLRAAEEHLTAALDEAMAASIVDGSSLRTAGMLAGLSENAVGPRLAHQPSPAYGSDTGRVTASGVERARYDLEQGRHLGAEEVEGDAEPRSPCDSGRDLLHLTDPPPPPPPPGPAAGRPRRGIP